MNLNLLLIVLTGSAAAGFGSAHGNLRSHQSGATQPSRTLQGDGNNTTKAGRGNTEVIVDDVFFHYTACLQQIPSGGISNLPDFVVESPTIIQSEEDSDRQYLVPVFSNVWFPEQLVEKQGNSEFCFGYLVNNEPSGSGQIASALPDVARFMSLICYGFRLPGYGQAAIKVEIEQTKDGAIFRSYLNDSFVYQHHPISSLPIDIPTTRTDLSIDSFQSLHAETVPGDGNFFKRIFSPLKIDFDIVPVGVNLGDSFAELFGRTLDASELEFCFSVEQARQGINATTIVGLYDTENTVADFYATVERNELRSAVRLFDTGLQPDNLEDSIYDAMMTYINPFGAVGPELWWMPMYRSATAVLDLVYLGLVYLQRKVNGQ